MAEIPAITEAGVEYPSWDALVEAESHGYIVTAILRKKKTTFAWSVGTFDTKKDAANARQRMRAKHKRDPQGTELVATNIYPLWKEVS